MIDSAAIRTQAALELCEETLETAAVEFLKLGQIALADLMTRRAATARAALQAHENGLEIGERGRLRSTARSQSPGNAPSAPVLSKGAGE